MNRTAIFSAVLAFAGMASVHAQTYTFTDLGRASGLASAAASINDAGQVVGLYADSNRQDHAVAWINGQTIDLGLASQNFAGGGYANPWSVSGYAISINNAGQAVWTQTDTNYASQAMTWRDGSTTTLNSLGGTQSRAYGINQAGQIVGQAQDANGDWQAVVWTNGQPTALGTLAGMSSLQAYAINDTGLIAGAGTSQADNTVLPVMWNQGVATTLDAPWTHSYQIRAYDVNNAGQVVGSAKVPNDVDYYRAVEWDHGVGTLLDMPSSFYAAEAKSINDAGQVVGFILSQDPDVGSRAAMWVNGQLVDLNSLLPGGIADEGWVLLGANGINNAGQIVGQALNTKTGLTDAFVLSPVPESSTLAMMAWGLGIVALGTRKRRALSL